ncbi:MAG: response regulator [Elusimicrobia bacterium]|nr:response regulator [Elusimicrobiota bacterium]
MNHKAKILVVDDEQHIVLMLSDGLKQRGYKVETAFNGKEAVSKAGREEFDVAIIDIKMPEMDGIAALGEIKKMNPEVEVIMATGYGTMGTAVESMRKGAFDYVHKPFELSEIVRVVERAVEKRRFNDISRAIFSTIESNDLLEIIVNSLMNVLKADDVSLMLFDPKNRLYTAISSGASDNVRKNTRLLLSEKTIAYLKENSLNSLVLMEEPGKDPQFKNIATAGCDIKFGIFLPLTEEDKIIGLININRTGESEYFNESDLQRVKIFGSLASLALRNAKLYKQLQETQSQLIQAEKMSALGQLAGGLAHEISNPLSGILGLTQLILENSETASQNYKDLKEIEKAVFRCKKIISSLLSFARQDKFSLEPVNINEIIEETLVLCARQMEVNQHVKIVKRFGENLPRAHGDFQQLMQVFLNLITNARDVMPDGGELTIETGRSDENGRKFVTAVFRDTGPGIRQDIIDKIFDPFFTTKPVGKGTGLGLSVCMGIVHRHNGKIEATNGAEKGAVFTVSLPACE